MSDPVDLSALAVSLPLLSVFRFPLASSDASDEGVADASSDGVAVSDGSAVGSLPGSTPGSVLSSASPEITAQLAHAVTPWSSSTFSATDICCERLARSARGANAVPP